MITRDNYEIYFLDYHEGRLNKQAEKELDAFLNANPDLKNEFDAFDPVKVPVESFSFIGKADLKKFNEGDLDHPKIEADLSIVFPNKRKLKKGGVVIPLWTRVAAAAVIVLGVLFYVIIPDNSDHPVATTTPHPSEVQKPDSVAIPSMERKEITSPVLAVIKTNPAIKRTGQQKQQPAKTEEPKMVENPPVDQLATNNVPSSEPTSTVEPAKPSFTVFTDEELVEIAKSSSQKDSEEIKTPALGKVLKTARSLFGVNSDYTADHNKEVFALGSVEFSRNRK